MNIQIALSLLLNVIAISARSLQGYNCREYPVFTGNPNAPLRTVRVCGTLDYAATPNSFHLGSRTEDLVRRSSSSLYNGNSVWSSSGFQQYPKSWLLTSPSLSGYEPFNQIDLSSNNPSTNYNELNFRNSMEVQRPLQLQLSSLVEDVSEVKDSIGNLVPYVKDILDTLRLQNPIRENEENLNVNFKLDTSIEALFEQFFQLKRTTAEEQKEQTTVESIQNVNDSQEEENAMQGLYTTESSSEKDTTAVPHSTTESSIEKDATEEENDSDSVENFDTWLRLKFGPSVTARTNNEEIEDTLNKTSEEESSPEESDESFETWFNAVYRSVTTDQPNNSNSDESTQSSHETNESSNEDKWEHKNVVVTSKSSEISKRSSESDRNVDYETYFVPTTTSSIQQDTSAATGNNSSKKLESTTINECYEIALSISTSNDFKKLGKCIQELIEANKLKNSVAGKLEIISENSKESGATESATTSSTESTKSEEYNYSESNYSYY